jgi:hypothetical protein
MKRLEQTCCGDCASCDLLNDGAVDMIPCILDQMFKRVQAQAVEIEKLTEAVENIKGVAPFVLAANANKT